MSSSALATGASEHDSQNVASFSTKPTDARLRRRVGQRNGHSVPKPATAVELEPRSSEAATLPRKGAEHSPVVQIWLASRVLLPGEQAREPRKGVNLDPTYRTRGDDRPLTLDNIRMALALSVLLWRRFLGLFWKEQQARMTAFILRRMLKGFLPAAR